MPPINVHAILAVGKKVTIIIDSTSTVKELRERIIERGGSNCDYIVAGTTMLRDKDDATLKECNIQNGSTVIVVTRMHGGTGLVDREALFDVTCGELEDGIRRLPHTTADCEICYETARVVKYCHSSVCDTCLRRMCKLHSFNIQCMSCNARQPVSKLIPALEPFVTEYATVVDLLRNVDVQLCRCGTVIFNSTMRSHALCSRCGIRFCFFCGRDWNRGTMRDQPHKCSTSCTGFTASLLYEPVDFEYSTAGRKKIPNRRPCPMCWTVGAYDMKCKYHKCTCGHEFCFMCMKSEADCKAAGGTYGSPCPIRELTVEDAPRLAR